MDLSEPHGGDSYVEPTVEEQFGNGQPNRTIVHLPLLQKEHPAVHHPGDEKGDEKGDENRKQAVIELMRGNSKISITDISKETGLTKRQVEKTIISLKEEGSIHREGPAIRIGRKMEVRLRSGQ